MEVRSTDRTALPQVLPTHFCWTRFGAEAGETVQEILERKEEERERNGGVFLWGIGNALGPSIRALLRVEASPEVIFSPMLSAPKKIDLSPPALCLWAAGRSLDGEPVALPRWSHVTSRAIDGQRAMRHYALVCYSDRALTLECNPPRFSVGHVENLLSRKRVGASQVTAVVRRVDTKSSGGATYQLAFRARLAPPFFVELTQPRILAQRAQVQVGKSRLLLAERGGPPSH